MGQHRFNPRAGQNGGLSRREREVAAQFKPGDESYKFEPETVVELNKEKFAEVKALLDAAEERGEDPRLSVPRLHPRDNPEFFDLVVYDRVFVLRPSPLQIDPRQIPAATSRWGERLRIPLTELRARADAAFAEAEASQETRQ